MFNKDRIQNFLNGGKYRDALFIDNLEDYNYHKLSDNLKKFGMVSAPIWGAFAALDGYHYAVGNQPVIAQNIVMTLIMAVFAVMFFIKSRD